MDVVFPKPGRYVVAVSGGVDSMALLDVLSKRPELELVVAHFDHGIRPDSGEDRQLVESVVCALGVPWVGIEGKLGKKTSEAKAREERYKFLRGVMKDEKAKAIITAHHQDDLVETAILNMLRGTGRKGLSSLKDQADILRPLLGVTKKELIDYALQHKLRWREDSTNKDTAYLRNYVRHNIVPKFDEKTRAKLLEAIENMKSNNSEIDELLIARLGEGGSIQRKDFSNLPHGVAAELMAEWLRQNGLRDFDRKGIEKLVVSAKTAAPGTRFPVLKGWHMAVNKADLALEGPER